MVTRLADGPSRREAAWVVACRAVGIGATLASNILAARLLGPAEFGAYLLLTTIIALGSLLAMAGLNEAGLRFVSESLALGRYSLARSYVRGALAIATVASVAAIAIVGGLGLVAGRLAQPLLLIAVGVGIAVLAWQQLGAELIRGLGNLRLASLFSGGQAGGPISNLLFLAGLSAAWLAAAQMSALLALGIAVATLCVTCPLVYLALWRTSRGFPETGDEISHLSLGQRRELLTVGGFLLVNQLLAFTTQQLDIWLAGGMLSPEALGLYGAAKRSLLVAAMPVQMAMLTIVSTIPRLYAQGHAAKLQSVVRRAATAAAIPALIALGALTIFPRPIFAFVLGQQFTGADTTLLMLAAGHYVLVILGNPQHVLTMTGRHRAVLLVNFISALVLVVVGTIGARLFGAPGLAAGSAASLALQNGILWRLTRRELGIWTHVGFVTRAEAATPEPVPPKTAPLSAACPP